MATTVSATLARPTTGVEFARVRLALGLSVRAVARALEASHHSVEHWERSQLAIPDPLATEWRAALERLAEQRAVQLASSGYLRDVRTLELGALLRAYAPHICQPDSLG